MYFRKKLPPMSPEFFERIDERPLLSSCKRFHRTGPRRRQRGVECSQQSQPLRRDPAQNLSSIFRAALPPNQVLGLKLVEQASDARRHLDHAIGNVQCWGPRLARPPQNAQHVVLLQRNSMRLDELRKTPSQHVAGPVQSENCLLRRRIKRLRLPNLIPQTFGFSRRLRCHAEIDDMSINVDSRFPPRPTAGAQVAVSQLFTSAARLTACITDPYHGRTLRATQQLRQLELRNSVRTEL